MYYYNIYAPIEENQEPISSFDAMLNNTTTQRYFLKCFETETIPEDLQSNQVMHRLLQHPHISRLLEGGMERYYQTYQIPKNSGGFRTIHAPSEEVKTVMRDMLNKLAIS